MLYKGLFFPKWCTEKRRLPGRPEAETKLYIGSWFFVLLFLQSKTQKQIRPCTWVFTCSPPALTDHNNRLYKCPSCGVGSLATPNGRYFMLYMWWGSSVGIWRKEVGAGVLASARWVHANGATDQQLKQQLVCWPTETAAVRSRNRNETTLFCHYPDFWVVEYLQDIVLSG